MEILLLLLFWIGFSVAAGFYAIRLNRSGLWVVFALLISPLLAFVLLFALGEVEGDDADDERIPCPFCAEDIRPEAALCPHCRSDLASADRRAARLLPRNRQP
jgi:hypothetical protein